MNLSLNWLKKYINLDSVTIPEITHKLTMTGIEVESIETSGKIPDGIIVAEIQSRKPHPNSDHLSICEVFTGKETLQIVCGAANCDAGQRVPLATLGTTFIEPDGKEFVIKPSKLRGEASFGMMCSARELGLSNDHAGLMILPKDTPLGIPMQNLIENDTVFELELTSNRPDWLSHWGIARDLAAALKIEPKFPEVPSFTDTLPGADFVHVEAKDLCPRYMGRKIRGITIKESPEWMQKALIAIGLRPINNIVDVTNYILHELGQPLHAFDLNQLSGQRIIVRTAKEGEKFTTLDNKTLELKPHNLLISDAEKGVALAGVMGGLNSGVTEKTTDILLESAVFYPPCIRTTSRETAISSDSSYRFERGIDFNMTETALNRATDLILQCAGGTVESTVDVKEAAPERPPVRLNFARINTLLGTTFTAEEMMDVLKRLGCTLDSVSSDGCVMVPPMWRHDLTREADAAEEIVRVLDLENVPVILPRAVQGGVLEVDKLHPTQQLRQQIIALGFYECYSYSMVDTKTATQDPTIPEDALIKIKNPLNLDMGYMRPTLFSQMLQNIGRNISRSNSNLKCFEMGRVFCAKNDIYPEERQEVVLGMTGLRHPSMHSAERTEILDFYDMKGHVEALLEERKWKGFYEATKDPRFVNGRCIRYVSGKTPVVVMGEVHPKFLKGLRLKHPLFIAMIQQDALLGNGNTIPQYENISNFPPTGRDIAFVANESLTHQEVVRFISKLNLPFLESVTLFDIFRDDKTVGTGKKSMAYNLTFRNYERTLTDEEVNKSYEKARESLAKGLGVELR